jgi:hypothetical protein
MKRWMGALLASATLGACSDPLQPNPAPLRLGPSDAGAPDSPSDGMAAPDAADAKETAPVDAGPVKRSVTTRSPYGNLAVSGNLMFDGDFEWSGSSGQLGWAAIASVVGQIELPLETGWSCRSGLRCARVDNSYDLVGHAVAASDKSLAFSIWIKVPGQDCNVISLYLMSGMTQSYSPLDVATPDTDQPAADGWCRYQLLKNPTDEAITVYLSASWLSEGEVALVDDAVLTASDGQTPRQLHIRPVPTEMIQRISFALEWLRQHRQFARRPVGSRRLPAALP